MSHAVLSRCRVLLAMTLATVLALWDAWQAKSLEWLAAQKMIPQPDSTRRVE